MRTKEQRASEIEEAAKEFELSLYKRIYVVTEVLKDKAVNLGWDNLIVSVIYRGLDMGLWDYPYFLLVQTPDKLPLGIMALDDKDDILIPQDWFSWLENQKWVTLKQIFVPVTEDGTIKEKDV